MKDLLGTILSTAIATVGGFFAGKSITQSQTRKTISSALTTTFMHRFSASDFLPVRDEVDTFLAGLRGLTPSARLDRCAEICRRETPESIRIFNRLHSLGMLFAEIGAGFQQKLIDVEGLAIFDRILPYYWREMASYIAASHAEFGFPLDNTRPLAEQKLTLFSKFAYAYNEMHRYGIARE
jgi:hypothetical protein